jgi:hypothetical protein
MVAYSFQREFVQPIRERVKTLTIRAHRRGRGRHSLPGERMQLYVGMRTRRCEKIIPDPVCVGLADIRIDLRGLAGSEHPPKEDHALNALAGRVELWVDGKQIVLQAMRDAFALLDGFGDMEFRASGQPMPPFTAMVTFWMSTHGPALFEGVCIHWEDQP